MFYYKSTARSKLYLNPLQRHLENAKKYRYSAQCYATIYHRLYINPSYSRILIGSRLWSFRRQMHDWRHHYKVFLSAVLKWRKVVKIRIIFYVTGQNIRYKKSWRGIEQVWEARRRKIKSFVLENDAEKFSSSLSRQSSTKLVLVSREPFFYLEVNKPNKQNVSEINLFKNSTIPRVKITVDTLIDVRNETSKHLFLKSDKINT